MKIIGLTGGIGMGKSTAAAAFRRARIPVFDADLAVHRMQAKGGRAVKAIEIAFPGTTKDGAVDRHALRHAVLADRETLTRLEYILHPMVEAEERAKNVARDADARATEALARATRESEKEIARLAVLAAQKVLKQKA